MTRGGLAETTLTGNIDAEVLKVGHHGSSTSSSTSFLKKVKPLYAIISVGAGNSYKHPSNETVQRLKDAGATVFRTDINGNIVVETDGKTCTVMPWRLTPVESSVPQVQPQETVPAQQTASEGIYVGSKDSDKYHYPTCRYAQKISAENQVWFQTKEDAQAAGYQPCGVCKP